MRGKPNSGMAPMERCLTRQRLLDSTAFPLSSHEDQVKVNWFFAGSFEALAERIRLQETGIGQMCTQR